jgi:hypothetical protein
MAESTERFEGKTPEEIKEELARFLQETLERDLEATGNPDLQQWWKAEDTRSRRMMSEILKIPRSPQEL